MSYRLTEQLRARLRDDRATQPRSADDLESPSIEAGVAITARTHASLSEPSVSEANFRFSRFAHASDDAVRRITDTRVSSRAVKIIADVGLRLWGQSRSSRRRRERSSMFSAAICMRRPSSNVGMLEGANRKGGASSVTVAWFVPPGAGCS